MSIQISDRSVTRTIKDLVEDFYVRQELNHDWALQLGLLVDSGVELEPIYITRDGKVIDGRHRIEAHELAKKTEIRCKIVEADDDVEFVVFALKCNLGGSLPPNKGDIEHTIQELLNRGVPKKQLAEILAPLPTRMVRAYLNDVESRMQRTKLQKAALAISNGGLSVPKAAVQYDVPEDQLKALLNNRVNARTKRGVEEAQRQLSVAYRSLGNRNSAVVRRLMEAYQDGDVSHKQVMKIFTHLDHLVKVSSRKVAEWRKRFDAMEAPKKIA
ncbi:MAG: ParB N-terminal domain-containing protein [Candidatus Zambryskibacteria bacterium]|nr:ParB N-terminal domain-containing protein [Candidatus Zambryskibacteria bacterium]